MLGLDHWESIFLFTNTNWDTEKSYLEHVCNIAAVVIFLVYYFWIITAFFSWSLFSSHLFTSTGSFLFCKFLHTPSSAALSTFPNPQHPLHVGSGSAMAAACSGHCCCCGTSVLLFPCTLGDLDSLWTLLDSALGGGRAPCAVSLSQAPAQSIAAPAEGFGLPECPPWDPLSLFPSSRAVDDLSFSIFLLIDSLLINFWPYQCVLLALTLHFRGQALFYFFKPQVQVELWKLQWPK